jgi:hypothetical protein
MVARRFRVAPELSGQEVYSFGSTSSSIREWIYLGKSAEVGSARQVRMDVRGEHVIAIFGKRGSGKSYTLGSLAEALVTTAAPSTLGQHSRRAAVVLLDTLNIYPYTEIPLNSAANLPELVRQRRNLEGWDIDVEALDVTIWVPAGHRWAGTPDHYVDYMISCSDLDAEDWASMLNLDAARDPQGQLLVDAYDFVTNLRPDYHPDDMVEALDGGADFVTVYHDETVRALRRQLRALSRDQLFARVGTPLAALARSGNLAVLMTNQLGDGLRSVLAGVLFRSVLRQRSIAAYAQKQLALNPALTDTERANAQGQVDSSVPPTWVLVDEAQNLIPAERRTSVTDSLVKLVREGRNCGVSVVVTTQQPSALDQRVLSQVDTMLIHQLVTHGDIDVARRNLKSNEPAEIRFGEDRLDFASTIRLLGVGQCVVSAVESDRWFALNARPRISAHGGVGASTMET